MPMTPEAEKNYRPRRPAVTADDVVTPESRAKIEAMKQEAQDAKDRAKADKAYEDASTTKMAKGGKVRGWGMARGAKGYKTY